jgi:hypothetical protein
MTTVYFQLIGHYWFRHFSINTIAAIVADLCREVDSVPAEYQYAVNMQIASAVDFMEKTFGVEATRAALWLARADHQTIVAARKAAE